MSEAPRIESGAGAPASGQDPAARQDESRGEPQSEDVEKFMRELQGDRPRDRAAPGLDPAPMPAPSIDPGEARAPDRPGAAPLPAPATALPDDAGALPPTGVPDDATAPVADADPGADRDERRDRRAPDDAGTPPVPTPFDLFRTAAVQAPGRPVEPAADPAARDGADARLDAIAQVVERMSVSDGSLGTDREVRIELRHDVLPGAELRIAERDGALQVEFVLTDPASQAWLDARTEAMAGHLAERLRREVRVRVRAPDADGNTAGDDGARRDRSGTGGAGPAGAATGPAGRTR